jgi:hypothetical protein
MEVTLENIFQLFAESEKQRAAERAEYEKQRESERQERFEQRAAELKQREIERIEYEKQRAAEAQQRAAEAQQHAAELVEFEKKLSEEKAASDREFKRFSRDLGRKLGEFSNVLGLYAEAQTKERIRKMFGKLGIELRSMSTHYVEEDGQGGFLYEIDILLYNTIYAIAVEVKNQLKKDDVDDHLARLDKCITSPPRGTEGKILLGAVATMIISQEVETYAKRKGFYVIKPSGKSVKIANDASFKPKEWQTKV